MTKCHTAEDSNFKTRFHVPEESNSQVLRCKPQPSVTQSNFPRDVSDPCVMYSSVGRFESQSGHQIP